MYDSTCKPELILSVRGESTNIKTSYHPGYVRVTILQWVWYEHGLTLFCLSLLTHIHHNKGDDEKWLVIYLGVLKAAAAAEVPSKLTQAH